MGAAPAEPQARPARHASQARPLPPISAKMRIALGFLHTGALFREPNNLWRCRAFPQQPVRDTTVRALEARGFAVMAEYRGNHDLRRAAMTATPEGRALYRRLNGRFADRSPPPLQVEGLLRENELAMAEMKADEAKLSKVVAAIEEEAFETKRAARRIEMRLAALQAQAARFTAERARIVSNRQDLGAFTRQAAERIGAAIGEARDV